MNVEMFMIMIVMRNVCLWLMRLLSWLNMIVLNGCIVKLVVKLSSVKMNVVVGLMLEKKFLLMQVVSELVR